ncbi:general odorant-binding protein 67 [Aedes albopictus]|uniref:OBP47-like domain-containing protein n=1 Tax=Aedes albopictus TaxID=7160 RepID=A0ABM1YZU0_AEDAL|nr:general odorant-binding protein 67-like [Aedes albopictus]
MEDKLFALWTLGIVLFASSVTDVLMMSESLCKNNTVLARNCCRLPGIINQSIVDECDDKFPHLPPAKPGAKKTEGSCVVECMYKAIGAFQNSKLDLDITVQHVLQTVEKYPNFQPLVNETVSWCFRNATENPTLQQTTGCSFVTQEMNDCVKKMLFISCPPANWTSKPECDVLKGKMAEGCTYSSLY